MTKPISFAPVLSALALALALVLVACSGGSAPPPTPTSSPSDSARITLASTDLAVGDNRVVFALIQPGSGAVKDAQVEVQTFYLSGADSQKAVQTVPRHIPRVARRNGGRLSRQPELRPCRRLGTRSRGHAPRRIQHERGRKNHCEADELHTRHRFSRAPKREQNRLRPLRNLLTSPPTPNPTPTCTKYPSRMP